MRARYLRIPAMVLLALGWWAITKASLVYFDDEEYAPFMLEKL